MGCEKDTREAVSEEHEVGQIVQTKSLADLYTWEVDHMSV